MNHLNKLEMIEKKIETALRSGTPPAEVRQVFLGRKGELTAILRGLSELDLSQRIKVGKRANQIKALVEDWLQKPELTQTVEEIVDLDASVPAYPLEYGTIHPVSAMIKEMVGIFGDLSFEVVEGSEIVSEEENFESLNMDADHPARDTQDSFYLNSHYLLRTQMSAVQVPEMKRRMQAGQIPIRIVAPGKTYRRESDQTHAPMFHQLEAVMVDSQTTFTDLKGILDYFTKRLFGSQVETRFRPHYFPYTEPSAELDIRWKGMTSGEGKQTGWLEFGGCGMIHPEVLRRAGINPKIYQGWAFGMSVERPIMLRKQIPDLRRLFDNPVTLLNQFPELG